MSSQKQVVKKAATSFAGRPVPPSMRHPNGVYDEAGRLRFYQPWAKRTKVDWSKIDKRMHPPGTMVMPDGSLLYLRAKHPY